MNPILCFLERSEPAIAFLTLAALVVYTLYTYRIMRASVAQARGQLLPCVVLEHEAREAEDQIVDSVIEPASSVRLGSSVIVTNVGAGPAHSISLVFRRADKAPAEKFTFALPHLAAGAKHTCAMPAKHISKGNWHFEATYTSLAEARLRTRYAISDGLLSDFRFSQLSS